MVSFSYLVRVPVNFYEAAVIKYAKISVRKNHVDSDVKRFKVAWLYTDFPMKIRPWLIKGLG